MILNRIVDLIERMMDITFSADIRFVRFLHSIGGRYLCPLGLHVRWDVFAHPEVDGMTSALGAMIVKRVPYCCSCGKEFGV